MSKKSAVKANCRFCGYLCGLNAVVNNGRITEVSPDYTRFPGNPDIQKGCQRWRIAPEWLDHPQRINYPQKRIGERGSGKWQRITWEEALDEIAERLQKLKDQYGAEILASAIGGPNTNYFPLHRFMNLFGSPNNMGIGQICWNPGTLVNALTYGWTIDNELDPEWTKCLLLWGTNPAESDNSIFWRRVIKMSHSGKPIIVVDPRETKAARRASIWLKITPGTDAFLALGMLSVIIEERLYNQNFVNEWCHGFEHLKKHLAAYSPEQIANITGIDPRDIATAARLYAGADPSSLATGRGIDQSGKNSIAAHRALAIMRAITGNLDKEGASHLNTMPEFISEIDQELSENYRQHYSSKQLGNLLLHSYSGYERLRAATMLHGKRLPLRYMTSAHPNLVWKAMIEKKPYPIKSLIVMGTNPLLTQANTGLVYEALKSLDLLITLELFETPTTMLSDYVLPSTGGFERDLFETKAGTANFAYGGQAAIKPYYERRPDYYFFRELGIRLGQKEHWPYESFREELTASLTPVGYTWEKFCRTGLYWKPNTYMKYMKPKQNENETAGFATKTGKVELYSEFLADLGYDPLPMPEILESLENYPLTLITGARYQPYYGSSLRHFASFKRTHGYPRAEMDPSTAERLGLKEGQRVQVETENGSASFVLKLISMSPKTISVEYGWWFPELNNNEPSLGGLWISNANTLTSGDFCSSDPLIGTWTYNGIPCRIHEAKSEFKVD